MSLEQGYHFIYDIHGDPIALHVDITSEPRAVIKHVKPVQPNFAVWNVQKLLGSKPNTYILSNRGSYTSPIDELVWVVLTEGSPPAEEWVIEPAPGYPPNSNEYVILTDNKESGWIVPKGEKEAQIACSPVEDVKPSVFQIVHAPLD